MGKKLYQDNTIKSDNTNISVPLIPEDKQEYIPSQEQVDSRAKLGYYWDNNFKKWVYNGQITDLGGKPSTKEAPSNDNYFHWWRGSKDRWNASMNNGTNPYHGISNTIVPAAEGALFLSGITSLPKIPKLIKAAKTQPHGLFNLFTNLGVQTGTGIVGSAVGYHADKLLGGTGEVGGLIGGLGSLYGLNKIPFMRDFNQATSRPFNTEYKNGERYYLYKDEDGLYYVSDVQIRPKDRSMIYNRNGDVAVVKFDDKVAHEIHLGSSNGAPDKGQLHWAYSQFKGMPSGSYITPDATATNRVMRIQNNGVWKELMAGKPKYESLINPPTVDGFTAAVKMGNRTKLDWADNTYLTSFHDQIQKTDNQLLYNAYHNFMNNKNETNLNALNKVLIDMGARPASFVNNELRIPFPIIFKP